MSLHAQPIEPVPEETARVARAAFRRGAPCLQLRDILGSVYTDAAFGEARQVVERRLGPPLRTGSDASPDRHRHAVWRGLTALLILQQCAFDVQFGLEPSPTPSW